MFENLVSYGSALAVVLMIYAYGVVFIVGGIYLRDRTQVMTPGVVRSTFGTLMIVAALPTVAWPAIYVGLWDGIAAGLTILVGQWILAPMAAKLLGVTAWGGLLMGIHFYCAAVSLIIGYWMSFTNLP